MIIKYIHNLYTFFYKHNKFNKNDNNKFKCERL